MDLPPWRPAEAPAASLFPSLRLLRAPHAALGGAGLLDRIMNESDGDEGGEAEAEEDEHEHEHGDEHEDEPEDERPADSAVDAAVLGLMAEAAEGVRLAARGSPRPLAFAGVIQPPPLPPWIVEAREVRALGRQLRAPQPPEEIDLTLSDEEPDDAAPAVYPAGRPLSALGGVALTDGEEARSGAEEDEDVQIIGSIGASSLMPPNPRRKRRRPSTETQSTIKNGFDPNTAESTAVSLHNADVVEQLKQALKCSICLDHIKDMTSTMCGHVFCARCITAQVRINAKCPLCQRRLQLKDIHPLFF